MTEQEIDKERIRKQYESDNYSGTDSRIKRKYPKNEEWQQKVRKLTNKKL